MRCNCPAERLMIDIEGPIAQVDAGLSAIDLITEGDPNNETAIAITYIVHKLRRDIDAMHNMHRKAWKEHHDPGRPAGA